jgi:hypothetical protein
VLVAVGCCQTRKKEKGGGVRCCCIVRVVGKETTEEEQEQAAAAAAADKNKKAFNSTGEELGSCFSQLLLQFGAFSFGKVLKRKKKVWFQDSFVLELIFLEPI